MNLGLARKGSGILGSKKLTANGAKAFNHIEETRCLQLLALHMLSSRAEKIQAELKTLQSQEATEENIQKIQTLNTELQDIKNADSQIENANETAIDFTTMELAGEPKVLEKSRMELSKTIARDYIDMLSRENVSFFGRKKYIPTKQDKQQAIEVGALVHHLDAPTTTTDTSTTRRLEIIKATQSLNRNTFFRTDSNGETEKDVLDQPVYETVGTEVFKEPKGEKFLLSAILSSSTRVTEENVAGYTGASPVVKQELTEALRLFQSCRVHLQVHREGEGLHVKKVGDLGTKVAHSLIARLKQPR